MGDLLMSSPAIRALKESFDAKITVLTSSMARGIAKRIDGIDDVIIYDLPWIKTDNSIEPEKCLEIIDEIKARKFDAIIIFSVYCQNPLPAAMLAYLAGVPRRLAYCRENPYGLLSNWIPDTEPYTEIKHQVRRDLDLVAAIGAYTRNERLCLNNNPTDWDSIKDKLLANRIDLTQPWIILHPGVSERKREYPFELWIETARALASMGYQILFTGSETEKRLTYKLQQAVNKSFSLAGVLDLNEFIELINRSPLVISVNTATIHLAAAVNTPMVVLYALSNPQHFPWKATGKVFLFDVAEELKSRNEVITYVNEHFFSKHLPMIKPETIVKAAIDILNGQAEIIPELPECVLSRTVPSFN